MKLRDYCLRPMALTATAVFYIAGVDSTLPAQMIVAHRGASEAAPENTLAAFQLAWEEDADAIEGDFYLTADGHIVALHDDNTKRTAGVELKVADSRLAELRQLDVGAWKAPAFRGQTIPTLAEVLANVPAGKKILIELKCGPEIVPALKEELEHCRLQPAQTIVIAFQQSVVRAVKQQIPGIKAYWLTSYKQDKATGAWTPTLQQVLTSLRETGADGLDTQANQDVVDAAFIQAVRDAGYEVHTWTIDDPQLARHYQQLGVESITTNCPRSIRDALMTHSATE